MSEEKYLMALSSFENAYIQYTKGSVSHKILRNDIQSYVESLENKLREKEKLINKLKNQPTAYITKYLDEFGFVETKTLNELIDELEKENR